MSFNFEHQLSPTANGKVAATNGTAAVNGNAAEVKKPTASSQQSPQPSKWATTPLESLAQDLEANTRTLSNYLRCIDYQQPSLARDTPHAAVPRDAPQEILIAKEKIMDDALKIFHIAMGPSMFVENVIIGYHNMTNLRWLSHFGLFDVVPLEGTISYAEAAQRAGVTESRLKSVARMAMTNNVFAEPVLGQLAHSATSAALKTNHMWNDQRVWMSEIIAPTISKMVEAHEKWPQDTASNHAAFNYAFNTDLSLYKYISQDPQTYKLFGRVMDALAANPKSDIKHLVHSFDWAGLGKATVVDIGGNIGHGCVVLAENFPELDFICQDTAQVCDQGATHIKAQNDPSVVDRIRFQEHDFFTTEPVEGASVYLLRQILHNWDFDNCVKILKNVVPALRKGSHVAIADLVLPDPGTVPSSLERVLRSRDMGMVQIFNAKERDIPEWKAIIEAADPRLKIVGVNQPWGSALGLIDLVLGE